MLPLQLFKCLSDETRLNAVVLIALHGELCVCELVEALDQNQPKISRHLAQLRNSAVLVDRKQDQWVYYSLHPKLEPWAREIIFAAVSSHQHPSPTRLKKSQC